MFGFLALNQIKQTGQSGRGMAIAGIVISGCVIALFVIFLIIGAIVSPRDNTDHTYHESGRAMVMMIAEEQSV